MYDSGTIDIVPEWPRGYSTYISILYKAIADTLDLILSLYTIQHTLGKVYNLNKRANNRVRISDCEIRCIEA